MSRGLCLDILRKYRSVDGWVSVLGIDVSFVGCLKVVVADKKCGIALSFGRRLVNLLYAVFIYLLILIMIV